MTKKEIAEVVAVVLGDDKTLALRAVDATLKTICQALLNGQTVELRGFGVFKTVQRKAKTGYNFHTNSKIYIPGRAKVKFKFTGGKL